jgi:hypothetical protein
MSIQKNEMVGHVACMGKRKGIYGVLVVKPEGKSHLEDPGIDGNIEMDLQELGCGGMDWIELAQNRDR